VHGSDAIAVHQVQRIERPVHEHALRIEHRAHGAVTDEDAAVDGFEERCHG
jgi:hypothetical protein